MRHLMRHCRLCQREIEPDSESFCSESCQRIFEDECAPRLNTETVLSTGRIPRITTRLGPGCFMKNNLQNQE